MYPQLRDILSHVSLPAAQWLCMFSASQVYSFRDFSVVTHFATDGCICVESSVRRVTFLLNATPQYMGSVPWNYNEVTFGTADALQSGEWSMQCVFADFAHFLNYCGYFIKHRGRKICMFEVRSHALGFVGFSETWYTMVCQFFRRNIDINREIVWRSSL
jgi:hypothetical protein